MELEALTRQTGVYGTVNKGDVVTVTDELGKELLEIGNFKKSSKHLDMATPDEVITRNESGLPVEPAGFDGTEREAKNAEGRNLVVQDGITQDAIEDKEVAQKELVEEGKQDAKEQAELATAEVKEDKSTTGRKTKEDKTAIVEQTK